jgi:hypothetical protein
MRKWAAVSVLGGVLMGASAFWFYSRPYPPARLVQMLPPDRAVHVFLDVARLRRAGILEAVAGAKSLEDADYRKFVADTGFDYRTDLDALAIAFRDGDVFYAVQGRFQWEKLSAYAPANGGSCDRVQCTVPGSEPGRNVSFYMPRADVLALATSRASTAADMIAPGSWQNKPQIPDVALWISAPPSAFADLRSFPAGARSFLSPLSQAVSVVFTLGAGPAGAGGFELRLRVTAKDEAAARTLAQQFREATGLFVKMLERENLRANPADLSGLVAGGRFENAGAEVVATWPVSPALVESLAAGVDFGP